MGAKLNGLFIFLVILILLNLLALFVLEKHDRKFEKKIVIIKHFGKQTHTFDKFNHPFIGNRFEVNNHPSPAHKFNHLR